MHKHDRTKLDFITSQGQISFLPPQTEDEILVYRVYFKERGTGIFTSLIDLSMKEFNNVYVAHDRLGNFLMKRGFKRVEYRFYRNL